MYGYDNSNYNVNTSNIFESKCLKAKHFNFIKCNNLQQLLNI